MVSNPVTCGPDATLADVDSLCARYRISGVPVTDADGVLVGIVTNRDIRFETEDRKSTRLNSSHANISYAVFCLKKKKKNIQTQTFSSSLIFIINIMPVLSVILVSLISVHNTA